MSCNKCLRLKAFLYPSVFLFGVLINSVIACIRFLGISECAFYPSLSSLLYFSICTVFLILIFFELFKIKSKWSELKQREFSVKNLFRMLIKKLSFYALNLLCFYLLHSVAEWNLQQHLYSLTHPSLPVYFIISFLHALFMQYPYVFFSITYPVYLLLIFSYYRTPSTPPATNKTKMDPFYSMTNLS